MSAQNKIKDAAQAVINRWDSPSWEWDKKGSTANLIADLRNAIAEAQPSPTEAKPASFTEVATLALDLTEAIWPRVKGIEQYELTNLAERCIYKGMELRKKHVPLAQPSAPMVDKIMEVVKRVRPITDDCPKCDGMGCSGPCPPRYWEQPMRDELTKLLTNP